MLWTKKHKFPVCLFLSNWCNQTSNILFPHATSEVILEEKVKDVIFVFQLQNNLFECFCHQLTLKLLEALKTLFSWSLHFTPGSKSMSYKTELSHSCSATFFRAHFWEVVWKLIIRNRTFSCHILEVAVQQNHRSGVRKGDWGFLAGKLGSSKTTGRNQDYSVFPQKFPDP